MRPISKSGKRVSICTALWTNKGKPIEFMLSAKRDISAARGFFKKMMRAEHRRPPFTISVDKNAAYPEALRHFTRRTDHNAGLEAAAHEILKQRDRARSPFHQKEGASFTVLQELSQRSEHSKVLKR
jgi:transposase-like protein